MARKKKQENDVVNIKGGVHGGKDVVLGNQTNNISIVVNIPAFTPPAKLSELRTAYLKYVRQAYRALDFRGIRQLDSFAKELLLEDIYVPLQARPEIPGADTWERRLAGRTLEDQELPEGALHMFEKEDSRPVPVENALGKQSRVVVLGDPGSGKSTILKYLVLRLAAEKEAPLPILVSLNTYARALQQEDINLQVFLPRYFAGLSEGVANLDSLFDTAIENGQALILLDGLDEVQQNRAHLVHKVEAFAADITAKGNKLVVTSRVVGYKDAPLPTSWMLYTLLDFDRQAIEDFSARWCLAFERGTAGEDNSNVRAAAEAERSSLLEAIDNNPGVASLASNPLLLTILALIKRQGVSLPNRRAELYDLYLDTLIRTWNKARALDRHQVGPNLDTNEILMTLGPLALWLREKNPTAGVVTKDALLAELTSHFMGEDWGLKRGEAMQRADQFLDSVRHYSNLLVERGHNQYGFMHLTFEEMLAAYGLYQRGVEESLPIIERHITDAGWRETILLAVGVWGVANKNPREAGKLVRAMLKMHLEDEHAGQNVLVAGACLEDVGTSGMGPAASRDVQEALLEVMKNRSLPPAVQRDAGFSLARSGWVPEDLDEWVSIPAGEFLYGDDKKSVKIEDAFAIQKYPVTNSQFKRFMDDDGYESEELWSQDGWAWRTGTYDTKAKEEYEEWLSNRPVEKRHEPYYWHDVKWNNRLAPVVGVTWFEAEAYANWLAKGLGREVRLPTEYEWERAARGKQGREYAWGDTFDRNKVNCAAFWKQDDGANYAFDLGFAGTSIVSQFKAGNTPDGIHDLSGNVYEWTNSWYEKEKTNRTLRGGSWFGNHRFVRCADRSWSLPGNFDYYIGFRLVSPGSD